ncbi:MAG TPA: hypothetical protein VMT10_13090, partial [Solirubrobacteraceae bacterium]|nr:hypothetical protein [Solirubrobacteraceae bacterium]
MSNKAQKSLLALAGIAALALGGSALAGAATSNSSSSSSAGSSGSSSPQPQINGRQLPNIPAHGTAAHEDAEKPVTGDAATKAKAAARKSVGSGTAGEVTTDFTQTGYEVTVTKSDGTKVEVHLDSSFNVMQGPGGHGGPPPSSGAQNGSAPYGPPGAGAPSGATPYGYAG